jgi:hypothetical protein
MSQNKVVEGRDAKTGRFLPGNSGNGGRPKGSRNKLGEAFISDLHEQWLKHGKDVLDRVVRDEPAQFLKTVAPLMPKEIDTTLTTIDVDLFAECQSFAQAFRLARQVIGAQMSRDDEAALIEHYEAEE